MQMIFNALSGSSGQVPVTPGRPYAIALVHGGIRESNVLCSMGIARIYRASQENSCSLEKAPQLYNIRHPRVL